MYISICSYIHILSSTRIQKRTQISFMFNWWKLHSNMELLRVFWPPRRLSRLQPIVFSALSYFYRVMPRELSICLSVINLCIRLDRTFVHLLFCGCGLRRPPHGSPVSGRLIDYLKWSEADPKQPKFNVLTAKSHYSSDKDSRISHLEWYEYILITNGLTFTSGKYFNIFKIRWNRGGYEFLMK